jgi:hypothetical protein
MKLKINKLAAVINLQRNNNAKAIKEIQEYCKDKQSELGAGAFSMIAGKNHVKLIIEQILSRHGIKS